MATIVAGELPRSFDPTVSEWGNPRPLDEPKFQISRLVGITKI